MNFSVTCTPGAQQELATVWLAAADRNAVTAASHRLDQDLARDPYALGFGRNSPFNRTATDLPLGIDTIIGTARRRILRVWSLV